MANKRPPFEPGTIFHVYNHGNAEDNIFREAENYRYFLKRYAHYIPPIAKTYAFCLLPNHFHLMVQIRSEEELENYFRSQGKDPEGFKNPQGLDVEKLSNMISHQFGTLLNSYTKAYNKYFSREGSLFRNTTKRKTVTNDTYYTRLITYIHQNPVHHGFVEEASDWPFSSYQILLSRKETKLERDQVLSWFGGKQSFLDIHGQIQEIEENEVY